MSGREGYSPSISKQPKMYREPKDPEQKLLSRKFSLPPRVGHFEWLFCNPLKLGGFKNQERKFVEYAGDVVYFGWEMR